MTERRPDDGANGVNHSDDSDPSGDPHYDFDPDTTSGILAPNSVENPGLSGNEWMFGEKKCRILGQKVGFSGKRMPDLSAKRRIVGEKNVGFSGKNAQRFGKNSGYSKKDQNRNRVPQKGHAEV